jgi:hypothetical protein
MSDRQVLEEVNRRLTFLQSLAFSSGNSSDVLSGLMALKKVVDVQLTKPASR